MRQSQGSPSALDSWLASNNRTPPDEAFVDIGPPWAGWRLTVAWAGIWSAGVALAIVAVWVIYQIVLAVDWLTSAPT